jgi:hypothetical protein
MRSAQACGGKEVALPESLSARLVEGPEKVILESNCVVQGLKPNTF